MATNWTYGSQVDLTNGGGNDLTEVTLISGLSAGITSISILYTIVSTNTVDTAPQMQLGDAGGFEITGYDETASNGISSNSGDDSGWRIGRNSVIDAGDISTGVMELQRWDVSEHIWFMNSLCHIAGDSNCKISTGIKTLSAEITQIRIATQAGTAVFDGGEARIRYR